MTEEAYKKDVASLTIALNTNDAGTIHIIVEKFKDYPTDQLRNVAAILLKDKDVFYALKKSLTLQGAGAKDDDVCKWLYNWYQVESPETRQFVLQFLPLLIWTYLYSLSQNQNLPGIEACLLCIYNHEVVQRNGQDLTFNPPSLSVPSYLHRIPFNNTNNTTTTTTTYDSYPLGGDNNNANNLTLTENALRQFNKQAKALVTDKRLEALDTITGGSRPSVLKVALKKYNSAISYMPDASLQEFCKMCKRLVSCGFDFTRITPALRESKAFSNKYKDDLPEPALPHTHTTASVDYISDDESSSSSDDDDEIITLLNGTTVVVVEDSNSVDTSSEKGKGKIQQTQGQNQNNQPQPQSQLAQGSVRLTKGGGSSGSKLMETKASIFAKKPRLPLSASVLQEMVSGLTFCVFKVDTHKRAIHACVLIHLRASHDLIPEVILSVNALLQLDVNEKKEPTTPRIPVTIS